MTNNEVVALPNNSHQEWLSNRTLYMDDFMAACHLVSAVVGIPLNLSVIAFIIGCERLHWPRTFTWIGVGFSNVLLLTFYFAELLAARLPSPEIGRVCAWFYGIPQSFLGVSLFVSLSERLLCLRFPSWYKRFFNTCWIVVAVQFGTFSVLFFSIKGRQLFGAAPSEWHASNSSDVKVLTSFFLACIVLGLASQAALWTASGRRYPPAKVDHLELRAVTNSSPEDPPENVPTYIEDSSNGTSSFVLIGAERVSRADLEAARSVTIGFVTFLIMAVPSLVTFALLAGCLRQHSSVDDLTDCARLAQTFIYLRALLPTYSFIVSPLVFVTFNRDIRLAIRDKLPNILKIRKPLERPTNSRMIENMA